MSGNMSGVKLTDDGRLIVAYSPETDWSYAAASGGLGQSTTPVVLAPAAQGKQNCLSALQLGADPLTVATEVVVRDGVGGTVLFRLRIGTAGLQGLQSIVFPAPLKSSVNTALVAGILTLTVLGSVYVNAQGFQLD